MARTKVVSRKRGLDGEPIPLVSIIDKKKVEFKGCLGGNLTRTCKITAFKYQCEKLAKRQKVIEGDIKKGIKKREALVEKRDSLFDKVNKLMMEEKAMGEYLQRLEKQKKTLQDTHHELDTERDALLKKVQCNFTPFLKVCEEEKDVHHVNTEKDAKCGVCLEGGSPVFSACLNTRCSGVSCISCTSKLNKKDNGKMECPYCRSDVFVENYVVEVFENFK